MRTRAADKTGWLYKYISDSNPLAGFSTTPAANYVIKPYPTGTLSAKGKEGVLQAIYYERGIELAMEGHRFFDLVRWGIADNSLATFFGYESKITTDLAGGKYLNGKNNYFPIPQYQIDMSLTNGAALLKQNPGYN